jgi:hypothetical protein
MMYTRLIGNGSNKTRDRNVPNWYMVMVYAVSTKWLKVEFW